MQHPCIVLAWSAAISFNSPASDTVWSSFGSNEQMTTQLLTIIVPTYNRAANLQVLLNALWIECALLNESIVVVVSDNASVDNTQEVVSLMQAKWPQLLTIRHAMNCGPEENFCRAVERVQTRYFWIVGDDDCPRRGVLGALVELLRTESPSLVYMQSKWMAQITDVEQREEIKRFRIEYLDAKHFARKVHVWITYISGHVVDRSILIRQLEVHPIRRFSNTNLVQLGWILSVLQSGGRFAFIADKCVLATIGNSGGYALLTVFGVNFTRVVNQALGRGSRLARIFVGRNIACYLPGLHLVGSYCAERATSQ